MASGWAILAHTEDGWLVLTSFLYDTSDSTYDHREKKPQVYAFKLILC